VGGNARSKLREPPALLDDAVRFGRGAQSLASTAFFAYQGAWQSPVRDGGLVSRLRLAKVSGARYPFRNGYVSSARHHSRTSCAP
jgi:hypothetical protein